MKNVLIATALLLATSTASAAVQPVKGVSLQAKGTIVKYTQNVECSNLADCLVIVEKAEAEETPYAMKKNSRGDRRVELTFKAPCDETCAADPKAYALSLVK